MPEQALALTLDEFHAYEKHHADHKRAVWEAIRWQTVCLLNGRPGVKRPIRNFSQLLPLPWDEDYTSSSNSRPDVSKLTDEEVIELRDRLRAESAQHVATIQEAIRLKAGANG